MRGPKMTVSVDGLAELDANLGHLTKATARNVLRKVLTKAGQPIAETMRRLAPDDPKTGAPDLKTSIAVSPKLKNKVGHKEYSDTLALGGTKAEAVQALRDARRAGGGSFAEVYVGPGKGGAHGVLQEFGTVNHAPQPFARPAWEQHKGEALEIIKAELGGEIRRAAQRAARRAARKAAKAKA